MFKISSLTQMRLQQSQKLANLNMFKPNLVKPQTKQLQTQLFRLPALLRCNNSFNLFSRMPKRNFNQKFDRNLSNLLNRLP